MFVSADVTSALPAATISVNLGSRSESGSCGAARSWPRTIAVHWFRSRSWPINSSGSRSISSGCSAVPANTKYLYTICILSAQRLRRWSNIVQMVYKYFVFTGVWCTRFIPIWQNAILLDRGSHFGLFQATPDRKSVTIPRPFYVGLQTRLTAVTPGGSTL